MARIIDFDSYRQSKKIKVTDTDDYDAGYDYYPSDEACDYDDYYYENDDDFPTMDP